MEYWGPISVILILGNICFSYWLRLKLKLNEERDSEKDKRIRSLESTNTGRFSDRADFEYLVRSIASEVVSSSTQRLWEERESELSYIDRSQSAIDHQESDSQFDIGNSDKQLREQDMELTALIGLVGSVASIISLLQQNKEIVNPKAVLGQFRTRESDLESVEHQLGKIVTEDQILEQAAILSAIHQTDNLWLDRITKKCLEPYYVAIKDYGLDDVDVEEKRGETADCVCNNLKMARKDNGGKFATEELKKLWSQFGCS